MKLQDFIDAVRQTPYRWELVERGSLYAYLESGRRLCSITAVCLHIQGSAPSGDNWPDYWNRDATAIGLSEHLAQEIMCAGANWGPFRKCVRRKLLQAAGVEKATPRLRSKASAVC